MIPKIIHLVWFGGERPKKFDKLVDKIKKVNYDYEVIEWNDNNINFDLLNHNLFQKCENLGAKSDIFRFEVLFKHGGIYMDYDFIQMKKFDSLLDYDFFVGNPDFCPDETWNSIVGSVSNNKICEEFLKGLINNIPIGKKEIGRVMRETGPEYLHKVFSNHSTTCNSKKLTGKFFYPFPTEHRFGIRELTNNDISFCESFARDETFCIHLHTTTWQ